MKLTCHQCYWGRIRNQIDEFSSKTCFYSKTMATVIDDDRKKRLREIEIRIQDPRSIINVDCLIDAVQNIMSDCDHPAIRKIKNIDAFVSRCKLTRKIYPQKTNMN